MGMSFDWSPSYPSDEQTRITFSQVCSEVRAFAKERSEQRTTRWHKKIKRLAEADKEKKALSTLRCRPFLTVHQFTWALEEAFLVALDKKMNSLTLAIFASFVSIEMKQNQATREIRADWIWTFCKQLCQEGSDVLLLGILENNPQLLQRIFTVVGCKETIVNQLIRESRKEFVLNILNSRPELLHLRALGLLPPLPFAVSVGQKDIALELFKAQPECLEARGPDGNTALGLAVQKKEKALALELTKNAPKALELGNHLGQNPVHLAILTGKLDLALDLATIYPSVMEKIDCWQENPLHYLITWLWKHFRSKEGKKLISDWIKKFIQVNSRSLFMRSEKGRVPLVEICKKQEVFKAKELFEDLWTREKQSQGVWFESLPIWLEEFLEGVATSTFLSWVIFKEINGWKLMEVIVVHSSARARFELQEFFRDDKFTVLPECEELLGLISSFNPKSARKAFASAEV